MRAMRLALAGAAITSMLGVLSDAVIAQDEPITATRVMGTATGHRAVWENTVWDGDGFGEVRDAIYEYDFEWNDPRLPSLVRLTRNSDWHHTGEYVEGHPDVTGNRMLVNRASYRLDGPEGSWTGVGAGMTFRDWTERQSVILVGEGAYDGLVAYLYCGAPAGGGDTTCDGYIFEGEMPPLPGPVEPPTE